MKTAQEMLNLYIEAEIAVLGGQSFRMGERQLTRADLERIQAGRREWEAKVEGQARRGRPRFANADFGGLT